MSPVAVVKSFYKAWLDGDVGNAAAHCAETVRATQHFDTHDEMFSGTARGRAAVAALMTSVHAKYRIEEVVQVVTGVEDDVVRTITSFNCRNRATDELHAGAARQVWRVRRGLLVEIDVYLDDVGLRVMLGSRGPELVSAHHHHSA